jgi:WD domain, G-beta repeat
VRLWDLQTGQLISHLTGHTDCVSSVAFTPDGNGLTTGSQDLTAKHWNLGPLLRNMQRRAVGQTSEEGVEDPGAALKEEGNQNECVCTVEFRGHEVRRRLLRLHLPFYSPLLAVGARQSSLFANGHTHEHDVGCCDLRRRVARPPVARIGFDRPERTVLGPAHRGRAAHPARTHGWRYVPTCLCMCTGDLFSIAECVRASTHM